MGAPLCENEETRLQALYRYQILDTEPEELFDDITKLLAYVCKTPISLISFVDRDRQWFKSEIGLGCRETSRDVSFCAFAILQSGLYVVRDARADTTTMNNPLVLEDPRLRFYAGAPIITPDGYAIGTVNVIDVRPRTLSEEQEDLLMFMARQVMAHLELRYALRERDRLLGESVEARQEAERVSQMKDRFLAMLSHELRTPLNAVLGWVQLLQRMKPLSSERSTEGLAVIERNARLQAGLIEGLLDLNRIVSGKLKLEKREVAVEEIAENVVHTLLPLINEKQLHLERLVRDRGVCVVGDSSRLQQILWNLLTNAVKFTSHHGTITLSIYRTKRDEICLEVTDTGKGIDAASLPHVFERFHQGEETSTRSAGGLGIGLAIVKELAEGHGGHVSAASPGLGMGSTFRVYLPCLETSEEVPRGRDAQIPAEPIDEAGSNDLPLSDLLILAVDDENDARELIRRILEEHGAHVVTAVSASDAVEIFQRIHPDLIVSDIAMPHEDGYQLMQRIRAEDGTPPAIALTAFAGEEDREKAIEAGYQSHLAKPFEARTLVEMAHRLCVCGRRSPQPQA